MAQTELEEIQSYWKTKYPSIAVTLCPRVDGGKYCGNMMTHNASYDLHADTIGELISQGEQFLRTLNVTTYR